MENTTSIPQGLNLESYRIQSIARQTLSKRECKPVTLDFLGTERPFGNNGVFVYEEAEGELKCYGGGVGNFLHW